MSRKNSTRWIGESAGGKDRSPWSRFVIRGSVLILAVSVLALEPRNFAQVQTSDPMAEVHRALALAQQGDSSQALTVTDHLLAQHPSFVPALKLQGMLLEDAGRTTEAAASYLKGLKLAPHDPDLLYKVGVYQLTSGSKDEAVKLLESYVRQEPKDGDGLFYLAQAYHLTGQDDLALKSIRSAVQCEPGNPIVLQKYGELLVSTGDSESGFDWLRKAQEANPHLDRIDFDLGVASLNRMEFQSAEQYAEKAVAEHPDDAETLELLASAKVKQADWRDAMAAYQRILSLRNDDRDALLGLGRCQLELKQDQAAVETLSGLLKLDPADILAHYYLARAYAGLGNMAEAQHQADLHQKMMQQSSFAASALGTEEDRAVWAQARELLKQGRNDATLKLFQAQNRGPSASIGHPYFLVGALYLYMGDPGKGIGYLHRALQLDPRVRGAHTYLGIYDLQRGQLTNAEKEFEAELLSDPNYETAVAELGLVRYRQQRWAEAADQLSRSRTRAPVMLLALSDCYFHLGKTKDADLTAEIAAAYAHNDQELIESLLDLLKRNGQFDLARRISGVAP